MGLQVKDVMRRDVHVVSPEMTLPQLEQAFVEAGVSGFPVVAEERVVGVVSRSDVVKRLCVEETVSRMVSDYYTDPSGFAQAGESLEEIGGRVGERIERLRVGDLMSVRLIAVSPERPIEEAAQLMVSSSIHRLPVLEDGRLVGLVSTLDLVDLIATRRVVAATA